MKQANCEPDFIMQMTGLSAEDIANLSKWAVINMLLAEYDYETDIAVQRAEEREIAFTEGIEQGIKRGFSDGVIKTALAFKKMGIPIAKIAEGTGLTQAEVEKL